MQGEIEVRLGRRWYRVNLEDMVIQGQRMSCGTGRLAWTTFWSKERGEPGPLAQELIAMAKKENA